VNIISLGTKNRLPGHQDIYAAVSFFSVGAGRIKASSSLFFNSWFLMDQLYPTLFIVQPSSWCLIDDCVTIDELDAEKENICVAFARGRIRFTQQLSFLHYRMHGHWPGHSWHAAKEMLELNYTHAIPIGATTDSAISSAQFLVHDDLEPLDIYWERSLTLSNPELRRRGC
jgi:hypothetical protein